jgi:hypothetical protein
VLIKIELRALRRTRWSEYLIRFVFGGAITALAGWVASRFGPALGGLFLAFPAIFPASATLMEKHEREKKRQAGIPSTIRGRLGAALEARGATMGALALVACAVVTWKLLPSSGLATTLAIALASWLAVSTLLWWVRKHHPWNRPKRRAG